MESSLFSTPSPEFFSCSIFNDGHFDLCKVVPHCSFALHFSNNWWCWASFHAPIAISKSFLESCLFKSLPIFLLCCLFLLLSYSSCFHSIVLFKSIASNITIKVFRYWEDTLRMGWRIYIFKNMILIWKLFLSLAIDTLSCFPWSDNTHFSF